MPQVIGGEIGKIKEEEWNCGECKDAGAEHKDTLAKVLMHCALKHDAWKTDQDKDNKVVRVKSKKADQT